VAGKTPTALSREMLQADGWHVELVEQTIRTPRCVFKRDLFGFVDLLALRGEEVLAVQTTSYTNASARVKKITESPLLPIVRKAGIAIHVHGWRKVEGKWKPKITDLS
jgi:hypothetical protein